eukprot:2024171-Alexandrium_andersonii.AAC.1
MCIRDRKTAPWPKEAHENSLFRLGLRLRGECFGIALGGVLDEGRCVPRGPPLLEQTGEALLQA